MPTVQVRFAPPLHERFIAECEKREVSPSEFIRRAVEAMMDHIDTPQTNAVAQGSQAGLEQTLHHLAAVRPASRGVRGYAADGSGEITQSQLLKNRQGSYGRKKDKS